MAGKSICISYHSDIIRNPSKFEILSWLCFQNSSSNFPDHQDICLVPFSLGNWKMVSQNLGIPFDFMFFEAVFLSNKPLIYLIHLLVMLSFNTHWVLVTPKFCILCWGIYEDGLAVAIIHVYNMIIMNNVIAKIHISIWISYRCYS